MLPGEKERIAIPAQKLLIESGWPSKPSEIFSFAVTAPVRADLLLHFLNQLVIGGHPQHIRDLATIVLDQTDPIDHDIIN